MTVKLRHAGMASGRANKQEAIAGALIFGIILVFGLARPAMAVSLSAATFYEFVSVGGNSAGGFPVTLDPGTEIVSAYAGYPRGTGTAIARTTNTLPLLAEGSVELLGADSPAAYGGSAEARINFQFTVEALPGGTPGALVPVDITTHGFVSLDMAAGAAGGASGSAFAILGIPGVFTFTADRACSGHVSTGVSCSSNNGETFGGTFSRELHEGTVYAGEMHVGVHGQGGGLGFFTDAYAMVDPTIVVQSPFADQYRVVFSPGVVPLPGAFVLLLSGVAGFGFCRRRATPSR